MAYTTINDPSAHFQTTLFTGNGGTLAVTNDGNSDLQPDFVWIKNRERSSYHHNLYDSTRGVLKQLFSNLTNDELEQANSLTAFSSDGFSLGSDDSSNYNNEGHIAWQWKANGGTTTTNAAGANGADHESVYQANDDAGFSIVTYTSDNQSGDTIIKHGLSTAPTLMFHKGRNADSTIWWTYHKELTNDGYMHLESTNTNQDGSTNVWRNTAPTSSVFKVGLDSIAAANGRTMVAYCFAPIQGYSKFGKFTGTADADGPFIHTGFKPAWLMIKEVVSGGGWGMWDNKRNPFNAMTTRLLANTNAGDDTSTDNSVDFLSNGFKMRTASGGFNQDGAGIVYMAFAESPFVSSEGIPTTAR
jgi:hypothetical protein